MLLFNYNIFDFFAFMMHFFWQATHLFTCKNNFAYNFTWLGSWLMVLGLQVDNGNIKVWDNCLSSQDFLECNIAADIKN